MVRIGKIRWFLTFIRTGKNALNVFWYWHASKQIYTVKFKVKFTIKYCHVYSQLVLWLILIMYYLYSFLLFIYPEFGSCVAFWNCFLILNNLAYCLAFAVFGDINTNLYLLLFLPLCTTRVFNPGSWVPTSCRA